MLIILDWDETITRADTTSLIAPDGGDQHFGPPFSTYVDEYVQLCHAHASHFGARNTLARELEYLESMKAVEDQIRNRIEAEGLFKDSDGDSQMDRIKAVTFMGGWTEAWAWLTNAAQKVPEGTVEVHIVSCSWSASFIRNCLEYRGFSELKIKSIRCNEIDRVSGRFRASADCHRLSGIKTALDKLEEVKNIIATARNDAFQGCVPKVVYIGDSSTDVPCLIEADLGIIMGSKPSTVNLCQKFDLVTKRENEASSGLKTLSKMIVTARDWHEAIYILEEFCSTIAV